VRRIINHKFFQFDPDILYLNSNISFDIYIKRSEEFVIIIEAGTLLTLALYEKIIKNKALYVQLHDSTNVKSYEANNPNINNNTGIHSKEELKEIVLQLRESLKVENNIHLRIKKVYSVAVKVMEFIFRQNDEILPLEVIYAITKEIIECSYVDGYTMPLLLESLPQHYTTQNHSVNVAFLALTLAQVIDIDSDDLVNITFTALLHDIGKIGIAESILLKPDCLSDNEFKIIMKHPLNGFKIVKNNGIQNEKILKGILHHHEKFDGTGYPNKLRGKVIPKFARVIEICDVFDALTTNRTFRRLYTSFEALQVMKNEMESEFDNNYLNAFIQLLH